MNRRPIVITTNFKTSLRETYLFIRQTSLANADQFVDEAYRLLTRIALFPEGYPFEHRLPTKRNLYRFKKFKKSYKIIFKVLKTKVIFIAVIYARRGEEAYQKLRTRDYR